MPLRYEQLMQHVNDAKVSNDWSNVESADVSNVKDMSYLFSECKNIEYLDLSLWDVSNVEDMDSMFQDSDFNNDSISQWDVSNVKVMNSMFLGSQYNHPLNDWDVSNVEDMRFIFLGSRYNQPLNDWDVSNVSTIWCMFKDSLYNQPLNGWNVSNIGDMESIFKGSSFFHDISSWDTFKLQEDDNDAHGKEHIEQCKEFFSKIELIMDTGIVGNDTDLNSIYEFLKTNESESIVPILEQRIMDKNLNDNVINAKGLSSTIKL